MFKNILIFVTGAAVGSVVTWKLIEKKYKDLADEEIDSVKESFKNRLVELENTLTEKNPGGEKSQNKAKGKESEVDETEGEISNGVIVDYSKIVKDEEYNGVEPEEDNEEDYTVELENEEDRTDPYVISPDEFGTIEHYGTKTLTYYADNILCDEIDQKFEDAATYLGPDWLDRFGEYEDDAVHIRDIDNEMDYEILKSDKLYSEISGDGE